jgi:DNA sulfur modification protein DndB
LLTVFNNRDPLARLSREIVEQVPVFHGRIEKAGKTVGKHSINLFTMNQVRAAVAEFLTGDSMMAAPQLKKAVAERLRDSESIQYRRDSILQFFRWFTNANANWSAVANSSDPSRDTIDAAELRQRHLHFTATGLVIIGRVANSILKLPLGDQEPLVQALGRLDWSREGQLWQGNVVAEGKVATNRPPVETAVAKVKQAIGLELTERDRSRLHLSSGAAASAGPALFSQ